MATEATWVEKGLLGCLLIGMVQVSNPIILPYSFGSSTLYVTWKVSEILMIDVVLSCFIMSIYALIMGIEQNLAKSIQARIFTSGEISRFRMISSLNHFRPKFWTEGDLGI